MFKKAKKISAAVLSAVMMLTAVATPLGDSLPAVRDSVSVTAGAASEIDQTGVLNKISQLKSLFPDGSYFSKDGKACSASNASTHTCNNCKLEGVLTGNSKAINTIVPSICTGSRRSCWTCVAFGRFAFCYIFGHDTNTNIIEYDSKNYGGICDNYITKLKPGDYLECFDSNGKFRHVAIFLGCDLSKDLFYLYEANVGGTNKVRYYNSRSYSYYGRLLATRSKNYVDTINLSSTPSDIGNNFESVIKCTSTGKVLSAGSDNNVTAVSYNGSNNQLWKFYKNSDNYYEIVNVGTGKRLDVSDAGTANGTNIQVWTDNDSSAQRWGVYGSQGSYLLKPKYSTSSVLDSGGGNNNVHLWTYANNIAAQKFTIEKMPSSWFSDVTAKNIKTNDARIALYANKPASAKATKYSIEVWQTNYSSNKKSYSFTPSGKYPNEGVESKQIYFDMIGEVGFTLSPATQYSYKITQYFTYLGASMSRTSGTYSFTTLPSSTHTHSYGSWYTKTSATCTSGGTEERKCSCGATESRSTSALGHNYGSTYYEAAHPHKYAHLCQRCGYKEFTGGNLAIYEKCNICYNENLPGKPSFNISSNGFNETDNVSFTWNDTEKTTHYVLTVAVLSGDEYKTVCRETYVNSGFQTTFGKGQYRALLQSYNSNMFYQYTSDWRDWVHNNSEYVYFNIDCAHEYLGEVVNPTFDREGYTQYTCTKCGDSYIDNYTEKLSLKPVTGAKLTGRAADALRINWNENTLANGYIIEMYKGGKWTRIAKIKDSSTTTYRAAGLKAGTAYKFRVRAYVLYGDTPIYSEYSATVTARTNPSVMTGAKLSGRAADALRINWTKNASADGYIVEMYQGNKWVRAAKITKNSSTTYRKTGLKASTAYKFRVRAYKMSGSTALYGNYSATVTARTNPSIMTGVKIGGTAKDALRVNWTKNTSAQGYIVEMYQNGKWVRVAKITSNSTTTFRKAGLAKNTAYKFRVCAYYMSGSTALYGGYGSVSGKTAAK